MSEKRYIVKLTSEERTGLAEIVKKGHKVAAMKRVHAEILLKADIGEGAPGATDESIAASVGMRAQTIANIRKRFVLEGLEASLNRKEQINPRRPRKLDGAQEAKLIALRCGSPPAGRARWTLRLLAEKAVELQITDSISHECVRETLKKTTLGRT